jgi:hypothetical protein
MDTRRDGTRQRHGGMDRVDPRTARGAQAHGGISIDSCVYSANRAWFGPHCTAVWLTASKERRLLYVMHGEVTAADHAAIRRHLKSLKLE